MSTIFWFIMALFGAGGGTGRRRNYGGFSWRRMVGISRAKYRFARATGIPTTRSGRQRKIGAMLWRW